MLLKQLWKLAQYYWQIKAKAITFNKNDLHFVKDNSSVQLEIQFNKFYKEYKESKSNFTCQQRGIINSFRQVDIKILIADNKYIYHINYYQCFLSYKMAEWKLKKPITTRIKSQLKDHQRMKSEQSQKLLNPWDRIGQALTQRYNRKFMELEKLEQEQKANVSLEGINRQKIPKFQIKRKYLSFDYKRRDDLEISTDLKLPMRQEFLNKIEEKNRLTLEYQSMKEALQVQRRSLINKKKPIRTQESSLGICFIANNPSKSNYKCIYIKKNRKKMGFNPELHISLKKTQAKSIQFSSEFENRKSKRSNNQQLPQSLQRKKLDPLDQKRLTKEKKMFRPWSGYQSDQNV